MFPECTRCALGFAARKRGFALFYRGLCASAVVFVVSLLPLRNAFAGGFYVPEQGARSVGMAGASVAQSGDASAIFHNPAGIAGGGRLVAELDGLAVFPRFTFFRRPTTNPNPTTPSEATFAFAPAKNTNSVGVVPFLGVSSDFGVEALGVGLGVYVPFGAALSMPQTGSQRNVVTEVALRSIHVTPTVAYRFWKRLRVGVGFSYIRSSFTLKQRNSVLFVIGSPADFPNPDPAGEGETSIEAHDSAAFGANFGVLYTDIDDRFAIGASLMTPTVLDFRGEANVQNSEQGIVAMQDAQGNALPAGRRTDNMALRMPMPMIVRIGARVNITDDVMIEVDANLQRWSTMHQLNIFFEHNYPFFPQAGAVMNDVKLEQQWHDTMSLRVASEVAPLGAKDSPLRARAGVLLDQSPIDDRHFDMTTPDSDKYGITAGASYAFKLAEHASLGVDLALMHLFFAERSVGPATLGTDPSLKQEISGTDRTILNKPASSFFYGVTRASVDLVALGVSLRL
jgi:long-chain fatty acid transport protein